MPVSYTHLAEPHYTDTIDTELIKPTQKPTPPNAEPSAPGSMKMPYNTCLLYTSSIHALVRVRLDHFVGDHPGVVFNPRTRESATGLGLPIVQQMAVSIHALVRVRRQRCSELGQVHRCLLYTSRCV